MFGYRVPAPDQAMLISGGKQKTEGAQFRVVIGHGAWIVPGFRKVRFIGLDLHKVDIEESCRSTEGILLNLKAVVAFKVQSDIASVNAAAQRFLGEQKQGQMEEMTNRIFAGHLRSIVGAMTVIDIHRNRDALAQNILEHSQVEMSRLGLTVDSLQIEHLDDNGVGYLDNLARETLAEAQKEADVATARAQQEAAAEVQENERKKADQIRQTALKQAAIKAEVDKVNAEAAQAGPLAEAKAQQDVLDMQRQQAERMAELREQQLVAEVVRPAEAEANRVQIAAGAEAARMKIAAEAEAARDVTLARAQATQRELSSAADAKATELTGTAEAAKIRATKLAEAEGARALADANAANDAVQLRLAQTTIMPEVARALAEQLGRTSITMLNGAEGMTDLISSFLTQLKMVREAVKDGPAEPSTNGEIEMSAAAREAARG
jgi:uncharacterized membrane protein YqiK